jgi:uncharacterized damage-inducible protein DinB
MITHLQRLLRYDAWANAETLKSLTLGDSPPQSRKWMAHIVGAECLWLARLRRQPATLPVWPDLSLEACRDHLAQLSRDWPAYLADHHQSLTERVSYINSKGEAWTNTVEEILTHVTIHSAYHRGQIASNLRSAGMEPAYTDYIHGVRQGRVK